MPRTTANAALYDEIHNDPLKVGYLSWLPTSPGYVAGLLNAPTRTGIVSTFVNARTILSKLGPSYGPVLDAIQAVGANNSAVKWAMLFMVSSEGIDVGDPVTQGMLDTLATAGAITAAQAAAVKGLAAATISRATELGIIPNPVQVLDVIGAE